jgi:hypothetical protein
LFHEGGVSPFGSQTTGVVKIVRAGLDIGA